MTQYYANSQEAFASMTPQEVSAYLCRVLDRLALESAEIVRSEMPSEMKHARCFLLEKERRALEIALFYVGLPEAKKNGDPS